MRKTPMPPEQTARQNRPKLNRRGRKPPSVPFGTAHLYSIGQADTAARPAGLPPNGVLAALRACKRRSAPVKPKHASRVWVYFYPTQKNVAILSSSDRNYEVHYGERR